MFKKLIFIAILFIGVNSFAQEVDFGVQAGYTNVRVAASSMGVEVSENASGFYVGFLTDFELNENWHIQPSVNYFNAEETDFLSIPVMVQYYIENSGFYLQAGPQGTIVLEDDPWTNAFGLDAAFGAGYHINENFFIEARYGFELTNRYSKEIKDQADQYDVDLDSGVDTFMIGVGYKF